jgi:hypothetical protein
MFHKRGSFHGVLISCVTNKNSKFGRSGTESITIVLEKAEHKMKLLLGNVRHI